MRKPSSNSSGTGTRSYINDGTSCQRSVYAYPSLLASQKGYALNFRACSGATITDVTNTQLSALNSATTRVIDGTPVTALPPGGVTVWLKEPDETGKRAQRRGFPKAGQVSSTTL